MLSCESKYHLLKVLRKIIHNKKSTIMIGTRRLPNQDDQYTVCLSPNIMKHIPKLPTEYNGFGIIYEELEPFPKFTQKIDSIF